jgi:hypothetical protein
MHNAAERDVFLFIQRGHGNHARRRGSDRWSVKYTALIQGCFEAARLRQN